MKFFGQGRQLKCARSIFIEKEVHSTTNHVCFLQSQGSFHLKPQNTHKINKIDTNNYLNNSLLLVYTW